MQIFKFFQNGSSKNGAIKNGGNDVTLSNGNGNTKDPEKADTELVMPVFQDVEYPMNDDVFESNLPKPPDGGWGWWVVFASFMIHVIGKTNNFTSSLKLPLRRAVFINYATKQGMRG